ncbi:hypothetical protein [Pontivivens ytuae]|uniref:Uncharacterized protein n=1 Tax=Pontivivens ytuae TaxID=2789856 RepID=A0A7S9LTG9_9RHOB|nr:hypothetical protein [Pontivivens ytuae]QPH54700.1 hypothetical protein I0K15_02660 [Pontivivens ytuae]
MAMASPGQWKAEWESAKKQFKVAAKKRPPGDKFMTRYSKSTSVTKALDALDKAYAQLNGAARDKRQAALTTFKTKLTSAETIGDKYIDHLVTVITEEKRAARTRDEKKKAADLDFHLEIFSSVIDICLASAKSVAEKTEDLWEKEQQGMQAVISSKKQYLANIPTTIKKAARWLTIQERDPTVKGFNGGITTATRDIYAQMGNLQKLYDRNSQEWKQIYRLITPINAWAMKDKKLPDSTSTDRVAEELAQVRRNVALIAQWYEKAKKTV